MNTTQNIEKTIPVRSIKELFSDSGDDWHSSDYYISPDKAVPKDSIYLPFRPGFYGLFLCVEGWMNIKINHQLIHVKPYCFFAASPKSIFQRDKQSPDCKGRALFFTKDFLLKNMNAFHLESFVFFSENAQAYLQLTKRGVKPLLQLYDILEGKRDDRNAPFHLEIIRSLFFTYLFEAAALYQKEGLTPRLNFSRNAELNLKFQQLLAKHDKVQHNLKFYADALFITPKYLIHAIKNASGKTPGKLIDEAIVAEAKLLLKDTDRSIASIAEELHFSDQAAFSKFFKKHAGISPLAYRTEG